MTKKQLLVAYRRYLKSNYRSLDTAYKTYSDKKAAAWQEIKSICKAYKGHNLKVVHATSRTFTVGFLFTDDETGEVCFKYFTHYHNYTLSDLPC